jgi:hypothetical protein
VEGCQEGIEQKFITQHTHEKNNFNFGFLISLFDIIVQRLFINCQVDLTKFLALGNHQSTSTRSTQICFRVS